MNLICGFVRSSKWRSPLVGHLKAKLFLKALGRIRERPVKSKNALSGKEGSVSVERLRSAFLLHAFHEID